MLLITVACPWHTCIKHSHSVTGMHDTRTQPYTQPRMVYYALVHTQLQIQCHAAIQLHCPFAVHPTNRHQCHHTSRVQTERLCSARQGVPWHEPLYSLSEQRSSNKSETDSRMDIEKWRGSTEHFLAWKSADPRPQKLLFAVQLITFLRRAKAAPLAARAASLATELGCHC